MRIVSERSTGGAQSFVRFPALGLVSADFSTFPTYDAYSMA